MRVGPLLFYTIAMTTGMIQSDMSKLKKKQDLIRLI